MFEKEIDSNNLEEPLTPGKISCFRKHLITILALFGIILVAIAIILIILTAIKKKDKNENDKILKILTYDKNFIKPDIKFNAEFQLVKIKNGMTGLLVHDPYSQIFQFLFQVENGYLTDTVPGLAHFAEHMLFGGSEKYVNYSIEREIGGLKGYDGNAFTSTTYQLYYNIINSNFKYEKAIDILVDALRYPLYDKDVIKKEIQPVNSEFYFRINNGIGYEILRQLSRKTSPFNGMGTGNNDTLRPNESEILSKKLKGYHMVVNRPEKIFFILYSNETIQTLQKYAEKYLNYKMHKFSDDEIDIEDKKQLEKNQENLKKIEIFDENLYQHGYYYNSNLKMNSLDIFFYIGEIDFIDLGFDIIDYYIYLFNSKSLFEILKAKNYISSNNKIDCYALDYIKNNYVISIHLFLTENGLKNIKDILLIIYKYADIMKKEGFKKEYFYNFIKFKNSQLINLFNKNILFEKKEIPYTFDLFILNYRTFGERHLFTLGAPTEKNYNEEKIKKYLNEIKNGKSFFTVNTISNPLEVETFLNSTKKETLNYYNKKFLSGEYPEDFKNNILDENIKYENLSFREINPYFSEKKGKVTPCYKEKTNKCKELNEFDYNKEKEYNGTLLREDDKYYLTYYQIDKSSESYIVNSYLEIKFKDNINLTQEVYNIIEENYIMMKLSEINELSDTINFYKIENNTISFVIKSFSDNTEKIIKNLVNYLIEEPKENEFNYSVISTKALYIENEDITFQDYVSKISEQFMNGGNSTDTNTTELIEKLENIKFEDFKNMHNQIIKDINLLTFKIAGNIDKPLVESIHDYFKEKIEIKITRQLLKNMNVNKLESNASYIYNFYQKSTMPDEVDNGILVIYKFDEKYDKYMDILKGCLDNIGMINLRFNYSNAYHPKIKIENNLLSIFEQGKFKEIPQMEDDINEVLLGMLNGNVKCENYADIVRSYQMKVNEEKEKTPDNLFNDFIEEKTQLKKNLKETIFPDTFVGFMDEISPIFKNPRRFTILIVRKDISDQDFENMFEYRKNNTKYILNTDLNIQHTKNIEFLKDKELA